MFMDPEVAVDAVAADEGDDVDVRERARAAKHTRMNISAWT
jgi:hypothetical protein